MKYETANALCVRLPAGAAVDIARCVPELAGVKQREHDGSGGRRHPGQQLADADARAGDVQAVGAQALDERAADTVPHGVEQNELAVKLPLVSAKPEVQQQKAHKVPQALVEKRRMYVHGLPAGEREPHAGEGRGLAAEGFTVDEVAPAADALPDEQAGRAHVRHRAEGDLFLPAPDDAGQQPRDHAAVDGEPALPDLERVDGVAAVVAPLEDDVVQPRADDGQRDHPDEKVIERVRLDAAAAAVPRAVEHRQNEAHGDDHAVPVKRAAEERERRAGVDAPVSEQGKADGGVTHHRRHHPRLPSGQRPRAPGARARASRSATWRTPPP